jgi:HSP20 family protein
MAISRSSPITDLVSLHSAMDRLFTDSLTSGGRRRGDIFGVSGEGFLPLDIYQNDQEWVIQAAVPSANADQVEVTCDGSTIRISGEIMLPENVPSDNYVMRENYYGAFSREVTLPEETVCDQTRAEFRNGMLVLTLPKAAPSKPQAKKIPVTAVESSIPAESTTSATSTAPAREPQPAGRK